ncbi:MAG: hypothetical protein ACE5GK_02260 [Nitrospiria bacterium]
MGILRRLFLAGLLTLITSTVLAQPKRRFRPCQRLPQTRAASKDSMTRSVAHGRRTPSFGCAAAVAAG